MRTENVPNNAPKKRHPNGRSPKILIPAAMNHFATGGCTM